MRISDWSSDCALPIFGPAGDDRLQRRHGERRHLLSADREEASARPGNRDGEPPPLRLSGRQRRREPAQPGGGLSRPRAFRSEEHTSELQSLMRISYAVFCLKKKRENQNTEQKIQRSQPTKTRNI